MSLNWSKLRDRNKAMKNMEKGGGDVFSRLMVQVRFTRSNVNKEDIVEINRNISELDSSSKISVMHPGPVAPAELNLAALEYLSNHDLVLNISVSKKSKVA
jgi:hypothetical protein